ncbi:hypothetical protein E1B28_011209 [Marasmius oreades]|uniref:Store-operated calcium entry-associated regulatory factor n=1 Tax=Marasmius oreades TaxID=181124 RepID=A0A9P7UQY8_9AGAR|nr:uncharacterized protein E1B28_011209 [Marasmius oreades]KAG7089536.1 hypothetical protein E1B28_011209 [Marasmius oreades]
MSKVKLENIKALTFYSGEVTNARRSSPVQQLTCVGRPCKIYQPEVVRCTNIGGHGTDVDWKCEADLPEALRFGRVQVSCEGWSKPGDSYVLQNSCGLEYRLVEVPRVLRDSDSSYFPRGTPKTINWSAILFAIPWIAALIWILYGLCWKRTDPNNRSPRRRTGQAPGPSASNWFPGGYGDDRMDPPPPYSSSKHDAAQGWRPGFWTGALAGGLADRYIFNNNRRDDTSGGRQSRRMWDWERPATTSRQTGEIRPVRRSWTSATEDRGEGSSNLGTMRSSSGFGGSTVR